MTDIQGVTLCIKCKIPFEEFTYEGQTTWWVNVRRVADGTPGWEWFDMLCNQCHRVHRFPTITDYWCPDCGEKEKERALNQEGGQYG